MSRKSAIVRLLGTVAGIVAIALAAATIRSPTDVFDGDGGGSGDGGGGDGFNPENEPMVTEPTEVPLFLEVVFMLLVAVLVISILWYLVAHHRRFAAYLLGFGAAVIALFVFIELLDPAFDPVEQPGMEEGDPNASEGFGEGDGDGGETGHPMEYILAAGLVVLALVLVGISLFSRRLDERSKEMTGTADSEMDEAKRIGAAAGRAAERIESTDVDSVDNEVYRAFHEMTQLLDVPNPETTTPGEFESAGIEAGLRPDHVSRLRTLFEKVRYGDVPTTEEMERQAVSTLRAIETEYSGGETDFSDSETRYGGGVSDTPHHTDDSSEWTQRGDGT